MSTARVVQARPRPRATEASFIRAMLGPQSAPPAGTRPAAERPASPPTSKRSRSAERDAKLAARMSRRFQQPGEAIEMLLLDVRYWTARRCGWDVASEDLRTVGHDGQGRPVLCDATATPMWRWWTGLDWRQRRQFVKLSRFRLLKALPLVE